MNNGIYLLFIGTFTVPLPDAWSARICKDSASDFLKCFKESIPRCYSAYLL